MMKTIMDCEEVLRSVLEIFNASICFFEGYWYVYRSNELFNDSDIAFYSYDSNGVLIEQLQKRIAFNIGSQINGFYPHHVNSNQKKSLERSLGAYRLNFQYGRVFPYYLNTSLVWTNPTTVQDWNILRSSEVSNIDDRGFKITRPQSNIYVVVQSNNYTVNGNPKLTFNFVLENLETNRFIEYQMLAKIKYVKGGNTYWLQSNLGWATSDFLITSDKVPYLSTNTFNITTDNLPESDGYIFIELYNPKVFINGSSGVGGSLYIKRDNCKYSYQ